MFLVGNRELWKDFRWGEVGKGFFIGFFSFTVEVGLEKGGFGDRKDSEKGLGKR